MRSAALNSRIERFVQYRAVRDQPTALDILIKFHNALVQISTTTKNMDSSESLEYAEVFFKVYLLLGTAPLQHLTEELATDDELIIRLAAFARLPERFDTIPERQMAKMLLQRVEAIPDRVVELTQEVGSDRSISYFLAKWNEAVDDNGIPPF